MADTEKWAGRTEQQQIKLLGRQALFARSKARYPAVFGGYCSGKTMAGCLVGIQMCLEHPGITGAVIRNTYPELRTSTKWRFMWLLDLIDEGKPDNEKVVKTSNEQYQWVKFNNGSMVFFLHTASEALYKGPEFGWFFIDQVEEMEEETVQRITTRLRQPGYPHKGMFAGNTDQGHNWCYRWFKLGQKKNVELFELNFQDNIANLDAGYVDEMLSYSDEWKKINLFGSWDAPGGLVVEPGQECFVDDFVPPDKWPCYTVIDPAESTGTTATLGWTNDFDGNYFICKEYYRDRRLIKDHAAGIRALWEGRERLIIADPMSWKKHQAIETEFVTIADRYREHGISAVPAANDIIPAIDLIRELSEPDPDHKHPITGEKPAPYIYYVASKLPKFFEELRSWMIEKPDKEPCHLMDCFRYLILTRLTKAARKKLSRMHKRVRTSFMGA